MIAIDTSVLIDVVGSGAGVEAAMQVLAESMARGPVVYCEVVLAEVIAGLGHGGVVMDRLDKAGIDFLPLERRAAASAGEMQRRYRARGGRRERAMPDFLIGAHALLQCKALVTRDAGFFRDYFKGLKVIEPGAT